MMLLRILTALLLFALPATAQQESVVAGLSQSRVSITATFEGTGLLIFGAVKREAPPPDSGPLHVVVEVTGPAKPVLVRRKEYVFGIWVNRAAVEIESAPAFYAIASTAPLDEILTPEEDARYRIRVENMVRPPAEVKEGIDPREFAEAVVRIRQEQGLYTHQGGTVDLAEDTLFKTEIDLPSNLVEGDYRTRIFLIRDKKVISVYEKTIPVRKVGLERWIFNLAHERPLIYGLLSLAIAIAAGWLASAIFRALRLT